MKAGQSALLWVGAGLTLAAAMVQAAGGWTSLERLSQDVRLRTARVEPQPMTSHVVHVDVDDRALRTQGRWPWPRARLASALHELQRAGARTLALDILFSDAQEPGRGPQGEIVDHDALLAEVLGAGSAVLAVAPGTQTLASFEETDRRRLLEVLGRDVGAPLPRVIDEAKLSGAAERWLRDHSGTAREEAARLRLRQWWALRPQPRLEDFLAQLPDPPTEPGRVGVRSLWERCAEEQQAWDLLAPHFQEGCFDGGGDAPIPRVAAVAAGAGFVNFEPDEDGVVRAMRPSRATPGGTAIQFGLAAAARHLGLSVDQVEVQEDSVLIGDRRLPLYKGKLWAAWPTGRGGWAGLDQGPRSGRVLHVSLGFVLELAEARLSCQALERQRDRLAVELAADLLLRDVDEVDAALCTELDAELGFFAEDLSALREAGEQLSEEERSLARTVDGWARLREAIAAAHRVVDQGQSRLSEAVRDRLVFVGWASTGSSTDVVGTAVDPQTPGVVVHAVLADMALGGRSLRFLGGTAEAALLLLVGGLCTLLASFRSPASSAVGCGMVLSSYAFTAIAVFGFGGSLLIPMIGPLAAGAASFVGCTLLNAAQARRDRQRITRQFEARVGRDLVHYLLENPKALSAGGQEREITILFADLEGFTTLAEKLGSERTVQLLNRCMTRFTQELVDGGAYVNKFLGDGLMAFWSAFREDPEQERRACEAALRCVAGLAEINRDSRGEDVPTLSVRLGIATGRVVVGDCGAPPLVHDYTVIGDAVNLSSRLESANKQFRTRILVDGPTAAGAGELPLRPLGRVAVVGQRTPVEVFELLVDSVPAERQQATQRALGAFREGRLEESALEWGRLLDEFGEDPLAQHYLHAIEAGEDTDGVLRLRSK